MLDMGDNLRAVGYVRVSTEDQAREGFSLDAQEERIEAYVKSRGWTLIHVYRDEGISAYNVKAKRPGYEAMIAARDSWDVIVTLKMDRLYRNSRKFLELMDSLEGWGKNFVSAMESFDTSTAMGKFVQGILIGVAEMESKQISERVGFSFDSKFRKGNAWFTCPPLGYEMKDKQLVLNPEEAKTVREIFRLAVDVPLRDVAGILDKRGLRGKNGGRFALASILQIVHNPAYAGYVYRKGTLRRNGHEAIVDDETFNRASVAIYRRTSKSHDWPLILGDAEMKVRSKGGLTGYHVYVPATRPADLDSRVAASVTRRPQVRRRKAKTASE